MSQIVKQIYKKGISTPYPIGVDADFVEMKSKLNLEEELKFGGNKRTSISETDITIAEKDMIDTTIIEYYFSDNTTEAVCTHTVFTYIRAAKEQEFPIEVQNNSFLVEQEEIVNPDSSLIVSLEKLGSNEGIIVHYYQGYKTSEGQDDLPLHQKVITISEGGQ